MREMGGAHVFHTPDGDLTQHAVFPKDNPSTTDREDDQGFPADFKKIRHLFSGVVSYDASHIPGAEEGDGRARHDLRVDRPARASRLSSAYFHGNLEALTYAYYDYPDLFEELVELYEKHELQQAGDGARRRGGVDPDRRQRLDHLAVTDPVPQAVAAHPQEDHPAAAGRRASCAGSIPAARSGTWSRPAPMRPTWTTSTRWRSRRWATATWRRCKQKFGHKLALMGNLHTTDVMLRGTRGRRAPGGAQGDPGRRGRTAASSSPPATSAAATPRSRISSRSSKSPKSSAPTRWISAASRRRSPGWTREDRRLIFGSLATILLQIMQYLVKQKDRNPHISRSFCFTTAISGAPGRLERPTLCSASKCSNPLSYEGILFCLERMGFYHEILFLQALQPSCVR